MEASVYSGYVLPVLLRPSFIRGAFYGLTLAGAVGVEACSGPRDDRTVVSEPSRVEFASVSPALEAHCGTLDCHGAPARNLRVYGTYGLRLSGSSVTGDGATTSEERDATYQSIVSVEPEVLSVVFHTGGANPARWIVVGKARGVESHVGGQPFPENSPGDRCIVSWIAGAVDEPSCVGASIVEPPDASF